MIKDCDNSSFNKQKQTTADYWTGHLPRSVTCFDWLDLYIDLLRNHTEKRTYQGGRAKPEDSGRRSQHFRASLA